MMNKSNLNQQEEFWSGELRADYRQDNSHFDESLIEKVWANWLQKMPDINSILECGSNIGRNLKAIRKLAPEYDLSLIEINPESHRQAVKDVAPKQEYCGSIKNAPWGNNSFDMTFTSGVLIHINPNELLTTCQKIVDLSKRYVLVAEYFNRTPVSIDYRGESGLLFKRDFGKYYLENFDLKVLDYGFLWGHEYDEAGFDDMTWWLFEKKSDD